MPEIKLNMKGAVAQLVACTISMQEVQRSTLESGTFFRGYVSLYRAYSIKQVKELKIRKFDPHNLPSRKGLAA